MGTQEITSSSRPSAESPCGLPASVSPLILCLFRLRPPLIWGSLAQRSHDHGWVPILEMRINNEDMAFQAEKHLHTAEMS